MSDPTDLNDYRARLRARSTIQQAQVEREVVRVVDNLQDTPMTDQGPLIDAKIAAAEARGDTKIAHIEGKLDTFAAKVDGRFDALFDKLNVMQSQQAGTKATIVITAIASVVAILGVLIGVLAYGGDQLGRGMEVRKAVDDAIQETIKKMPAQPVTIETDGSKK